MFRIFAMALTVSLAASAANAATNCSGGRHVADAQVVPPSRMGEALRATQYAWDGGERLVHVCNLFNNGGGFQTFWNLYSGEVDRNFGGICISLTGTNGQDWYSCATTAAVQRAFAAPIGSSASRLHFDDWQRGLAANISQ